MNALVFLVEGAAERALLVELLPRILPARVQRSILVFEGKSDLECKLARRIRGWQQPGTCFVVLRDQDSAPCELVKERLASICREAGRQDVMIRIACHELESWYLGDLQAVERGLGIKGAVNRQNKSKFRNPDALGNPSQELGRLTKGLYQKVSGSRAIGPHLDLDNARSHSFRVFVDGIRRLAAGCTGNDSSDD